LGILEPLKQQPWGCRGLQVLEFPDALNLGDGMIMMNGPHNKSEVMLMLWYVAELGWKLIPPWFVKDKMDNLFVQATVLRQILELIHVQSLDKLQAFQLGDEVFVRTDIKT
jgi:hypothetical protein